MRLTDLTASASRARRAPLRARARSRSVVVVVGAAGFIGSHTVDRLLDEGAKVIGIDNFSTGSRENLASALRDPNFHLLEADISEPAGIDTPLRHIRLAGVDAIIHLSALVSVQASLERPVFCCSQNVISTQNVAELARTAGIRRIVFASSAAVYGNAETSPIREDTPLCPLGPYGASKLAAEVILKGYSAAYGLETICHRYFNVYGPRQDPASHYAGVIAKFKDRLSKGEPVTIFGDGLQTRDFVHVTDVAAANVLAALRNEARSGSYNICTGRGTSLLDLLGYLDPEARSGGRVRYAEGKPGDIRESVGHPEAAEAELGFRAQVTVADALRGQAHPVLPLKPAPLDTLRIPAGV